jgi:hypothetical protein
MVPLAERVLLAAALKLKSNQLVLAGQARAWFISRDYAHTVTAFPVPVTTAISALMELPDGRILALGEAGATTFDASPAARP